MKNKTLMAALTVASLAFGGLALAKDKDHDKRGHDDHKQYKKHQKAHGKHGGDHDDGRRYEHSDNGRRGPPAFSQAGGRGAGPDHAFYKGQRLPVQYRDRGYWVDDWRGHRLSAPPAGYHWVQTGNDYVLVANNTGLIFQILLGQ
jgi:Ni/Co efflux regulator RcnB